MERPALTLSQCGLVALLECLPIDEMALQLEVVVGVGKPRIRDTRCRRMSAANVGGEQQAEPVPPLPNGLMADVDPTLV